MIVQLNGQGGRWSASWVKEECGKFFSGRRSIKVIKDLKLFVCRLLHVIHLGMELTESECADFMNLQWNVMKVMAMPDSAAGSWSVRSILGVDETLKRKTSWLARYKAALPSHMPEVAAFGDKALTTFCSALMDANMFAGGQSVPTVLALCLALPYSAWGKAHLPADFSLDNAHQHASYIYEVMRRFPPVAGFGWTE
eukprot:5842673-Prymnesium_polylepis.1